MKYPSIHFSGDSAFIVRFGDTISRKIHQHVLTFETLIKKENKNIITIPSYTDVLVSFDPTSSSYKNIYKSITQTLTQVEQHTSTSGRIIHLPVLYGKKFGLDIDHVARHNNLTEDEVIKLHSNTTYFVYMLGFSPGFPYLGGLSEQLFTPRKDTPRAKIEAGSVGIANQQTGVYSVDSPGGWQIIGKTPVPLFNITDNPPVLIQPGDYIQFMPITEHEYATIEKDLKNKKFKIQINSYHE